MFNIIRKMELFEPTIRDEKHNPYWSMKSTIQLASAYLVVWSFPRVYRRVIVELYETKGEYPISRTG